MTFHRSTIAALLVGLGLGYAIHGVQFPPVALANANAATDDAPTGRFQISSAGSAGGIGCYVVDTSTGEIWLARENQGLNHVGKPRLR